LLQETDWAVLCAHLLCYKCLYYYGDLERERRRERREKESQKREREEEREREIKTWQILA
jgi:hypothetical protein